MTDRGRRFSLVLVSVAASLGLGLTLTSTPGPIKKPRAGPIRAVEQPLAALPSREAMNLAERPKPLARPEQGHRIQVHPSATGDALKLQERIVAAFQRTNFVPDHRKAHFAQFATGTIRIKGWSGSLTTVTPVLGGFLVTVNVVPILHHPILGGQLVSLDYVTETYFFDGRYLRYLRSTLEEKRSRGVLLN